MKNINLSVVIVFAMLFVFPYCDTKAQQLDSLTLDTLQPFTSIQEALKQPEKVVKLELRRNKLKEVPPEVFLFKNLQYLDLSKNSIKVLPPEIDSLQALQILILKKNDLVTLPKQIGHLKNLIVLDVSQNDLVTLPPQIGDLENLEVLELWDNDLGDFPEQMAYLFKLKELYLQSILIDEDEQQRIKGMLPKTNIHFSPSCKCKTQ